MQLQYRGISYECNRLQLAANQQYFQPGTTLYLRVLRYRGNFYLQPIIRRLPNRSEIMVE